jgi:acyl dehydratase
MPDRYFEDIEVGERHTGQQYTPSKDEIIEFAERFDPQPFHVDEEAAKDSMFGGLIASGWHTGSISMRLLYDLFVNEIAVCGGSGIDDLRWRNPVRPGDTLTLEVEVTNKREWKDDIGQINVESTTSTTDDVVVMSMVSYVLVAKRGRDEN